MEVFENQEFGSIRLLQEVGKGLFYCPGLLRQKRKTGTADESDLQGKESSLQVV
jgi:hypothetical protein